MSTPYEKALATIDAAHAEDPRKVTGLDGKETTFELDYAQKMTLWLEKRSPNASETLKLAIRAQHLRRWEVPRSSYPMTKVGYHSWRTFLKKRQAELASQYCKEAGFGDEDYERVASMVRKEDFKKDAETQVLEDVACLVFLDDQFEEFEKEHDEGKIITILQKTWRKMSGEGHGLALGIPMSERCKEVVGKALA